jgi:hypothetical protein
VNVKAREVVNRWLADQEQNGHHHDEDAVSSIVAQRKP